MSALDPGRIETGLASSRRVGLPWRLGTLTIKRGSGQQAYPVAGRIGQGALADRDAEYVVHAANDYPELARVVRALLELRAAEAERERVGRAPFHELVAERGLTQPPRYAPINQHARFVEEVYRPYRERLARARAELEAALAGEA